MITLTFVSRTKDRTPPPDLKAKPRRSQRMRRISEAQISKPAFISVRTRPVKFR